MCTVTFIPLNNKIFITHNRDEKSSRSKAIPPKQYTVNGYTLLFPRDSAAGGSWIASNKNGGAAVLLNGAFEKHQHQPPYRKSRGLAFLDIIAANDLYLSYQQTDLTGIEPFTVILWANNKLYECRWNGTKKNIIELDAVQSHTLSSVTLYDEATIAKRKTWFNNWQQLHPAPSMEEIIRFHLSGGDGDTRNDLRMNRNGQMLTVSVTAIELNDDKAIMKYVDLQDNTTTTEELIFTKAGVKQ